MKLLKIVWQDLKTARNLDTYITASAAIGIAILGIAGIANIAIVFSSILATLAIISISLLVTRHQNSRISTELSNLSRHKLGADQFISTEYDLTKLIARIQSAQRVCFWATTLTTHIPLLKDDIRQCLNNGLEARFLLIKPSSSATGMAAFRAADLTEEEQDSSLRRNLSILEELSKAAGRGTLEYRVVDYLAPYTMYIFDPHLPRGLIIAILSTFRTKNVHRRPRFVLTRGDDKEWFDHFYSQFEELWNESEIYSIDRPTKTASKI